MGFFELFASVDRIRSGDASDKTVGMGFIEFFDRFAVEERECAENIYIFCTELVKFLAGRNQSSAMTTSLPSTLPTSLVSTTVEALE